MKVSEAYEKYKNGGTVFIYIEDSCHIYTYTYYSQSERLDLDKEYDVRHVFETGDITIIQLAKVNEIEEAKQIYLDSMNSAHDKLYIKYCQGRTCGACELNKTVSGCYLNNVIRDVERIIHENALVK